MVLLFFKDFWLLFQIFLGKAQFRRYAASPPRTWRPQTGLFAQWFADAIIFDSLGIWASILKPIDPNPHSVPQILIPIIFLAIGKPFTTKNEPSAKLRSY